MKRIGGAALLLALPLAACVSAGRTTATAEASKTQETAEAAASATAGEYDALIARYAEENGVPLNLAHAVIELESGYNAKAAGRGTVGLMQIKPATAAGIGYRGSTSALFDPATNLEWGMKYLGGAYDLGGGDVCGTALRYQGGHRATAMSASARRYCAKLKEIMAEQEAS
jgi:soluble lytic murein transglycosylase-like protein